MTIQDTILDLIVAALPDAYLWEHTADLAPPVDDLVVFDGIVPPQPPRRYVAVYLDDGTRTPGPSRDERPVCDESTSEVGRWQTTSVAPDRLRTSWLARRVRDALVDVRVVAEGYSPGLVRHMFSQLPQRDEQVLERPVVFAVDQYQLLAERVPVLGS